MIVTDGSGSGRRIEGFQVHLGGSLGVSARFGRKLCGLKLTAEEVPDYVERVVRRFLDHRAEGERFDDWVVRAADEDLE